ncbi:uncharacterized protein AB675_1153 [Cyphellophora attinorum]|uniref:Uncharacterized protein n=1 Tax=Cyphellophora attinorum TaxID=1664694 RepID=A0A0N1H6U3_9EURO|nr:uncharacterized protein AB675_1153 [Phialophora attinorum]KPI38105.1 hypothetical protein AB675_1153 [Phialophora attinorum]
MLRVGQRTSAVTAQRLSIGSQLRAQSDATKSQDNASSSSDKEDPVEKGAVKAAAQKSTVKRSSTQSDEDIRKAMEGLSGDGGEAGLELEDGKAVSMKRGVRENMFRYI